MDYNFIRAHLNYTLSSTDIDLPERYEGKVRDNFILGNERIIITTDRISAFDRILGAVPFKGQMLNAITSFWFEQTADIIQNHLIENPDPNAMVVRNCRPYPVEMIVRAYITGSLWRDYQKGGRNMYGLEFPDNLKKNQRLPELILTPTTKADVGDHDMPISEAEIIEQNLVPEDVYMQMKYAALKLFERGEQISAKQGLILVDTKYEFGDYNGSLMLIDEIHTPDSSRFWHTSSYASAFSENKDPKMLDKENIRQWLLERGFSGTGEIPSLDESIIITIVQRYSEAHRLITGKEFDPVIHDNIEQRLKNNLSAYM